MMFFKILHCDIRNGVFAEWKKHLITFVLFLIFSLLFLLTRRVTEYINPDIIRQNVTLGDYLLHIFAGTSRMELARVDMMHGEISFDLPSLWFFVMLWLLLLTLQYPYRELRGYGKHMIVLSGRRDYWWFSKCLWAVSFVLVYFFIAFAAVFLFSLCAGATPSFAIADFAPLDYVNDIYTVLPGPYGIVPSLVLVVAVSAALVLIELILSLKLGPAYSFLVMAAFLLASSYFEHPLLLPNYSMAIRSEAFVKNGLSFLSGLLLSVTVILGCMLAGYALFSRMDILGEEV